MSTAILEKLRRTDLQSTRLNRFPKRRPPVVWGKETLKIREDNLILEHLFYDQAGVLVKRFTAEKIETLGGRIYPTVTRIEKVEEDDTWTTVEHLNAEFGITLGEEIFTKASLKRGR